jgi:hypothetical protein
VQVHDALDQAQPVAAAAAGAQALGRELDDLLEEAAEVGATEAHTVVLHRMRTQ